MSAVGAGGGTIRYRRTWPQRLLITFNCLLIALSLAAASGVGYLYVKYEQLPRVSLGDALRDEPPGEPENWLLVGSDSREFVDDDTARESFGDTGIVGGQRADTIIVVRLDPAAQKADMLSFPRDLWVEHPHLGRSGRINEAFMAGPEALVTTITHNFGIPIHHYAEIDFAGFKALVDAAGGVTMYFPSPATDAVTGLLVREPGCHVLDGFQALAFVRSRNYQVLEDGRWRTDPTGDLGRINRQQDFVRRALRDAISRGLTNPAKVNRLINVGINHVTIDDRVGVDDIRRLAGHFRNLTPDRLESHTLPVDNARVGGASVLRLRAGEAQPIFDIFRGLRPEPGAVTPSSVRVRVLNGSGRSGEATRTSRGLTAVGFNVAGVGDARPFGVERPVIRFGAGQAAKAHLLARHVDGPVEYVEDPSLTGVDLVLTTGSAFDGVLDTPRPAEEVPAPAAEAAPPEAPPGAPPPEEAPPEDAPPPEPEC